MMLAKILRQPRQRLMGLAVSLALLCVGAGVLIYQNYVRAPSAPQSRWDLEVGKMPLSVADLEDAFASLGYDFAAIKQGRGGVPRVLVRAMPGDLGQVPEVTRRKALFLGSVLPLVLAVNEQIATERAKVEAIDKKIRFREPLSSSDGRELERLAKIYRIIDGDDEPEADENPAPKKTMADVPQDDVIDELLLRVAPMPVSLVLAQAAEESAWGLSRFAVEGNALYGQWVWNDEMGIIPKGRPEGKTHSVRAFRDIMESTLSYAHNLNTHRAYNSFRRMRANMLNATGHLDGHALAGTLTKYSGRGQAYVESLRNIIRANELAALDRASFTDQLTATVAQAELADTAL